MKLLTVALASASVLSAAPVFAQSTTTTAYGSAAYDTLRNCAANTAICDGVGQRVLERGTYGGAGQAVTSNFVTTAAGIGSHAQNTISFGDFGLPVIKSDAYAVGNVRLGSSSFAYQSYTYTGTESFDLLINALFHIDNASADGSTTGTQAHGGLALAGFAIWKASDFFYYGSDAWTDENGSAGGYANPNNLIGQTFLFGAARCGDFADADNGLPRGALAVGANRAVMGGGETSFGLAQETCGGGPLTINTGDEFVIATYTQLTVNRDAFIDATGTFSVNLDPTMGEAAIQAFAQNTTFETPAASDVPEPASWAMMIAGFGAVGAALRRRRAAVLALR